MKGNRMIKTARLRDGLRLPYREEGDRAGTPVVMLHGITDSLHSFDLVLPHLPKRIRSFTLTQRGHGDADRPPDGYRTRNFAVDIAGFMDAIGLDSAVVVGHSMGCTNAERFAIDHPRRVSGLVFAGAFASYRRNTDLVDYVATTIANLQDPIDESIAREFQESTLARPIPPEFLDLAVAESLKCPARVWRDAFAGLMEDDVTAELGAIAAPTLLVWGDRDALVPRADQDIALRAIASAKLSVYEGAGHALHWEQPERFAQDLTAFVDSLAGEVRAPQQP
jgi:pimeloyl-ACP methyl ester carboxylesterase